MRDTIGIYLLSGFLGSGKTTFLQNLLQIYREEKVGVIVNEFGAISIDGRTIQENGIEIREINNGSIFCSCLKANFVKTLVAFSKMPIDHLFIENTGMADPVTAHTILENVNAFTARPYALEESYCLVDCTSFLDYVDVIAPMENQVLMSGLVIMNKRSLVSQEEASRIKMEILRIHPQVEIVETDFSRVPEDVIRKPRAIPPREGDTTNQPWNRPVVYTLEAEGVFSREQVEKFFDSWKDKVLRLKGMIAVKDGYLHLDMAGKQAKLDFCPQKLEGNTAVIVFGRDSWDFREELLKSWEDCFGFVPALYD